MVEPEYAPAQLDRKAAKVLVETGAQRLSGILCMSQYTWNISRPVPYNSFVESDHDAPMMLTMHSISASDNGLSSPDMVDLGVVLAGCQARSH
jgi:hypothetical protein